MLGTPSLTVKAIVMGVRVQNFRCFQPEGSGSSGKLCAKSMTVTSRPPSGFSTSPRPSQKRQTMRLAAATSATPPSKAYRVRQAVLRRSVLPGCPLGGTFNFSVTASLGPSHVALPIGRPPPVMNASPSEESSTSDVPRDRYQLNSTMPRPRAPRRSHLIERSGQATSFSLILLGIRVKSARKSFKEGGDERNTTKPSG